MKIGIIGGGSAGIAAAIAAGAGCDVTILEKNDRIGKKLLATGNGRCNLSNLQISGECYHSDSPKRVLEIINQFGVMETLDFFHELGLMTIDKNGYIYPGCEQASAVLDVLRFALLRRGVHIAAGHRTEHLEYCRDAFLVSGQKDDGQFTYKFDKIILACGSRAGIKDAENGTKLAAHFGLQTIPFSPALVQLRCKEPFFKALAGVRVQAQVSVFLQSETIRESGEVQLTDYGISGIPVFQLSRHVTKALPKSRELSAALDFLPMLDEKSWTAFLLERKKHLGFETAEQFFTGTVHKKITGVILKQCNIGLSETMSAVSDKRLLAAGALYKAFPITITGSNPFAQAQVCAGGVRLTEVTDELEAKKQKGLYLAGEMLDADGRCGGYNLQWAWSTGIIAGSSAAGNILPGKEAALQE